MYTIKRTDLSKQPITVDMTNIKVQVGLTWVGQFHSRWGELLHENTMRLAENFAAPYPPHFNDDLSATFNKMEGMLWYDTSHSEHLTGKILKLQTTETNNADGWKRLEPVLSNTYPSTRATGEWFIDTSDLSAHISLNNVWEPITVKLALDSQRLGGLLPEQFLRSDVNDTAYGVLSLSNTIPRSNRTFDLGSSSSLWNNIHSVNLITETTHNIIPQQHNTYNLGTNSVRWREANVVHLRTNTTQSLIPITNIGFNLGSDTLKWNNLHTRTQHLEFSSSFEPIDNSRTLGSDSRRWDQFFANHLDTNTTKSLIPLTTSTFNLGNSTNVWNELHVNRIVTNIRTASLEPQVDNFSSLGTPTKRYLNAYINNLVGDVNMTDMLNFTIVPNSSSKGVTWSDMSDTHKLFVEEVGGTGDTHFVIENRSNPNRDSTVIRQGGSGLPNKDVVQVLYNNVRVNSANMTVKNAEIRIEHNTNGCRQVYNPVTNSLEFRFYSVNDDIITRPSITNMTLSGSTGINIISTLYESNSTILTHTHTEYQVSTNINFSVLVYNQQQTARTNFTITGLPSEQQLFVRVRYLSNLVVSDWSAAQSITTAGI